MSTNKISKFVNKVRDEHADSAHIEVVHHGREDTALLVAIALYGGAERAALTREYRSFDAARRDEEFVANELRCMGVAFA